MFPIDRASRPSAASRHSQSACSETSDENKIHGSDRSFKLFRVSGATWRAAPAMDMTGKPSARLFFSLAEHAAGEGPRGWGGKSRRPYPSERVSAKTQ